MTQTLPESAAPSGAATGDPVRISGGRLVAKTLKTEGIDTIFTRRGGDIIDIHDGYGRHVYAPGTMNQTMYK